MKINPYAALAAVCFAFSSGSAAGPLMPAGPDDGTLAAVIRKAKRAVVSIETRVGGKKGKETRVGSGFVCRSGGVIATRLSVIRGGEDIRVCFQDGSCKPGCVVFIDKPSELALLKIAGTGFDTLTMGETGTLPPSSQVMVLGNSLGVFPSLTLASFRGVDAEGFLNITASFPPGNCGGPVLDKSGRLIGLLAGRMNRDTGENVAEEDQGAALPVEKIRSVLRDAVRTIEPGQGWVGMAVEDLNRQGEPPAVRVVEVFPGGPAHQARIQSGDTLVGFQGEPIIGGRDLAEKVRLLDPDQPINFLIQRGKDAIDRKVKLIPIP
ncbi:MAG: serine protease [Acidobacteria bacterium]|nr:serine protease [Acidobacteriota bacterium]